MLGKIIKNLLLIFGLLFFLNLKAYAVTCIPIAWQLAQDTLSAKYGGPFYSLIAGNIKSVKEPKCDGDGWKDLAYELYLEGTNLRTSEKIEDIFVRIDVSEDDEYCSNPAFKIPPFPSGKHIFFLETETDSPHHDDWTMEYTICGPPIWDISLEPVIKKCFQDTSCSIDWFLNQSLPPDYFETYWKLM
tara:strand:+ start:402 stop:965 length:564 start_codon:yes stop_codon:yes gene_type:complete